MAVESKTAIRYCAKTMKKSIFLHKSVFCEKKFMVSASFWTTESCRDGNLWEETASARSTIAEKIWFFCNTCEQAEKTVYGLSFLLADKIVQNGNMPKKRDQADPSLQRN